MYFFSCYYLYYVFLISVDYHIYSVFQSIVFTSCAYVHLF